MTLTVMKKHVGVLELDKVVEELKRKKKVDGRKRQRVSLPP